MGSTVEAEYAAFCEKVKRTVYFDNLSPQVTETVLRSALQQFAAVKSIKFFRNHTEPSNMPQCALVEMESPKQAQQIVTMTEEHPFMISGMPRPVRARLAEREMFDDRPLKPGRGLSCRWLSPSDPDFQVAQELKHLTRKHAAEAAFLLKHQLQEEEKLANHQSEILKGHFNKHKLIEKIMADGSAFRLARKYNLRIADE